MASGDAVDVGAVAGSSKGIQEGAANNADGENLGNNETFREEDVVDDERKRIELEDLSSKELPSAAAMLLSEHGNVAEQAMVPLEEERGGGDEGKEGWEAAREWLWTLPRRRNVTSEEMEEWLQKNKHMLSREILTLPRLKLFRYLVAQHKLVRRTEEKEKLELLEPPTARYRRSDKWTPVYAWLESLDFESVVGAKVIDAWLSNNPGVKEDLLGQHTRHHLFHYIQKCHTNILKKRRKEVSISSMVGNFEQRKGVISTESSQLQLRALSDDNSGFIVPTHMKTLGDDQNFTQASYRWNESCSQNGSVEMRDVCKGIKVENSNFASKTLDSLMFSNGSKDSIQLGSADNGQPIILADQKGGSTEPFLETEMTFMARAEARKRYEILLELRMQLFDQIIQTREQMRTPSAQENGSLLDGPSTSAAPFGTNANWNGRSGVWLANSQSGSYDDFDGRSRRRSRDSARLQEGNAGSSITTQRSRDLKFWKRRKKGKEKFDNVVLSWSYSEVAADSSSWSRPEDKSYFENAMSVSDRRAPIINCSEMATSSHDSRAEVKQPKVACSPVRCLQERERGAGLGSLTAPFQIVGRGRFHRWKSFLQGWDSLERHFTGYAVLLQRKAFLNWLPCWSAYTSSVAVAAPPGMVDQGVQKVLDVRFHPQNLPQLVCSSNAAPNELLSYNLLSGRATELVGHNCQIQAVEYAANGTYVVSCASNLVKIWDSSTGEGLHTLGPGPGDGNASGHKKKINAMAVNHPQSYLVATSGSYGDGQLLLWNVNTGELACDLNGNLRKENARLPCMDALEFCDQNLLICGSDSSFGGPAIVQIWDVHAPENVTSFPANDCYITSLKTDPASKIIASGAGDGSVALFDLRTCAGIVRLPLGSMCEATSVSFSSCGTYFQASSTANRTLVWDTRMLAIDPVVGPSEKPLELADSASRKVRALHCLSHGTPMPTSENAGQMPGFVDEGDEGVNDAQWFHDTSVLVTASGNGSIAMWDMSLGDPCIRYLKSHSRCINTVAISPNDKNVCSGGDDQKVVLYQNTREKSASGWRLTHPLLEEPVD